jgi:hypothetical protein
MKTKKKGNYRKRRALVIFRAQPMRETYDKLVKEMPELKTKIDFNASFLAGARNNIFTIVGVDKDAVSYLKGQTTNIRRKMKWNVMGFLPPSKRSRYV